MALTKQLRGDVRFKTIPVVFLTGSASAGQIAEGVSVGVRHVIRKPFKVKDLVDTVGRVIRKM
jgi:CheY-like chemotaxis protein